MMAGAGGGMAAALLPPRQPRGGRWPASQLKVATSLVRAALQFTRLLLSCCGNGRRGKLALMATHCKSREKMFIAAEKRAHSHK